MIRNVKTVKRLDNLAKRSKDLSSEFTLGHYPSQAQVQNVLPLVEVSSPPLVTHFPPDFKYYSSDLVKFIVEHPVYSLSLSSVDYSLNSNINKVFQDVLAQHELDVDLLDFESSFVLNENELVIRIYQWSSATADLFFIADIDQPTENDFKAAMVYYLIQHKCLSLFYYDIEYHDTVSLVFGVAYEYDDLKTMLNDDSLATDVRQQYLDQIAYMESNYKASKADADNFMFEAKKHYDYFSSNLDSLDTYQRTIWDYMIKVAKVPLALAFEDRIEFEQVPHFLLTSTLNQDLFEEVTQGMNTVYLSVYGHTEVHFSKANTDVKIKHSRTENFERFDDFVRGYIFQNSSCRDYFEKHSSDTLSFLRKSYPSFLEAF